MNAELPNDVAGTLEVHKNFDGDGDAIIKNSEPKSKRKKVLQSVNWKKNTTLTELPKGKVWGPRKQTTNHYSIWIHWNFQFDFKCRNSWTNYRRNWKVCCTMQSSVNTYT